MEWQGFNKHCSGGHKGERDTFALWWRPLWRQAQVCASIELISWSLVEFEYQVLARCRLLALTEHHSCNLCSWAVGAVCCSVVPDQATVVSRYLKKPSGKAGFNCPLWKKFSLMPSPSSAAFNCRRLLWYLQPWLLIIFLLCTFKGYVCGLSATSPNWCGKIRIEVSDALHSTCIYSYCLF